MAQTCIDLNIFNLLVEDPNKTWTVEQLEKATGAESALLCMFVGIVAFRIQADIYQTAF